MNQKKSDNCLIHQSEIAFFCPSCAESPFKCVECVFEDEGHQKLRISLKQQGFTTDKLITSKFQELCTAEYILAPDIEYIQRNIKEVNTKIRFYIVIYKRIKIMKC